MEFFYNPSWSPAQTLLIATIPKNPPPSALSDQNEHAPQAQEHIHDVGKMVADWPSHTSIFVATAGSSGSLAITSGNLTCVASYNISNTTKESVYGLAILNGNYNGLFYGQICALVVCPDGSCNGTSVEATTVFDSFYLEGNFSLNARLYASVTTDMMYLAPVGFYETEGPYINSTSFNLPLLSATIFGIVWR